MNKLFVFMIVYLMILPLALAGPGETSPDKILDPGWNALFSYGWWGKTPDGGKVPGMFGYTIKEWELQVCSQHVTSDLNYKESNGFSGISTDLSKIYDTSVTLQAKKTVYSANQTLIEMAWYIHPKSEIQYNLLLRKGTQKLYILKNRAVDPIQGESGYHADYFPINYTQIVLEYGSGQELSIDIK